MNVDPTGTNTTTVTGAIRQAARMTGADFQYLLATAQVESNLNPNAQAPTSSARGLFQFTEQTWLTTLKEQGTALGYGPYANAISRQPSGDYVVPDLRMSGAVMNLRSDPAANSLMAGAFTKANAGKLAGRLGRSPTEGELYIAHFLGPTGASRLIGLADTSPLTPAATIFPGAARANPTIFYNGRGNTRSASEVYRMLVGRYDVARGGPEKATAVAVNASESAPVQNAFAPDTAGLAETYAAAARMSPAAQVRDIGAVFHGLFRSRGEGPVAPLVNSLWTSPQPPDGVTAPAPLATAAGSAAPVEASSELSLFQDQMPDARALFRGRV
ncbi:MAG: hypothetical protein QOJ15_1555 [Bradyrhizobium sp.]|jgi:hypothetical protein|nr:hypothetical protein [Bradyrhizobium sp.]